MRWRYAAGMLALALLPPSLGGGPPPSRWMSAGPAGRPARPTPAQAIRDGGCIFPGCTRPLAWCEAHHLWHWLAGGPTDLANLALVCRTHHRAVHEGAGG